MKNKQNLWNKLKSWQKGGVIGLIIGLISVDFILDKIFKVHFFDKWFFRPLLSINTLLTGCKHECIWMGFIYALITITLFVIIGGFFGFIIDKAKK